MVRNLLIVWLINALALLALPYLVPSVQVDSFYTALIAALLLGFVNALIRPILVLLTLPATVLTLGLFRPFAQVRLSRYLASVFSLVTAGTLDTLTAADAAAVSAVGEETVGFFDLDIGF